MACTRELWRRLGGWPEWLNYSEDTLFDQKARASKCGWRFAPTAVVEWRPRGSLRAIAKQFYRYGTGRGHTQMGAADFRYNLRNLVLIGVTAGLCFLSWWAAAPLAGLLAYFFVWNFHRRAKHVVQATARTTAYPLCLLVMWVVLASNLVGYLVGSWQRLRDGARFRRSMEEYLNVVGARSS
jgi:succinoglycan biosynthesis protein ExoA